MDHSPTVPLHEDDKNQYENENHEFQSIQVLQSAIDFVLQFEPQLKSYCW